MCPARMAAPPRPETANAHRAEKAARRSESPQSDLLPERSVRRWDCAWLSVRQPPEPHPRRVPRRAQEADRRPPGRLAANGRRAGIEPAEKRARKRRESQVESNCAACAPPGPSAEESPRRTVLPHPVTKSSTAESGRSWFGSSWRCARREDWKPTAWRRRRRARIWQPQAATAEPKLPAG